ASGSSDPEPTSAVLHSCWPLVPVSMLKVTRADAESPTPRAAMGHLTMTSVSWISGAGQALPPSRLADVKVMPAGTVSLMTMLSATEGPALVTVSRQVAGRPAS